LSDPAIDTTNVIRPDIEEEALLVGLSDEDAEAIGGLPDGSALLLVRRGGLAGGRYLLTEEVSSIGRAPDSWVFLDDVTVSRHHADIVMRSGKVTLEDQGSLNGSYVNRELVDGSRELERGDEVQIGKYRLQIFFNEHGA
jgi:pSer/pThr/pTyr-binding forkhead associated (FHA) protein